VRQQVRAQLAAATADTDKGVAEEVKAEEKTPVRTFTSAKVADLRAQLNSPSLKSSLKAVATAVSSKPAAHDPFAALRRASALSKEEPPNLVPAASDRAAVSRSPPSTPPPSAPGTA